MTGLWHLRRSDWLEALAPDDAATLRATSAVRVYEPGQTIFEPTAEPARVFYLEEGLVRLYRMSPVGAEQTVDYIRPHDLFGEVAVLADRPRECFAVARERSRALVMPRDAFVRALQSNSRALYVVTKRIGQSLLTCRSRAEDLVFRTVRSRVAQCLLRFADEYGRTVDGRLVVDLALSQQELATLVGATRQTVSATLSEMASEQLIARRRGLTTLLEPEALQRLAERLDA